MWENSVNQHYPSTTVGFTEILEKLIERAYNKDIAEDFLSMMLARDGQLHVRKIANKNYRIKHREEIFTEEYITKYLAEKIDRSQSPDPLRLAADWRSTYLGDTNMEIEDAEESRSVIGSEKSSQEEELNHLLKYKDEESAIKGTNRAISGGKLRD